MSNDTATDRFSNLAERLELFPSYLGGLSDAGWLHEIASFIASDLPLLSEDDRQDAYAYLVDIRVWVHRQAVAA